MPGPSACHRWSCVLNGYAMLPKVNHHKNNCDIPLLILMEGPINNRKKLQWSCTIEMILNGSIQGDLNNIIIQQAESYCWVHSMIKFFISEITKSLVFCNLYLKFLMKNMIHFKKNYSELYLNSWNAMVSEIGIIHKKKIGNKDSRCVYMCLCV